MLPYRRIPRSGRIIRAQAWPTRGPNDHGATHAVVPGWSRIRKPIHSNDGSTRVGDIWRRIGGFAFLIAAFALLLIAYLSFAKFETSYLDLVRSRYAVLLNDLRQTVEYGLNLGLRVEQMTQLQTALREARASDPDIAWIVIADGRDRPVFVEPQAAVPAGFSVRGDDRTGDVYLLRGSVANSFGQNSGTIVIAHGRAAVTGKLTEVATNRGGRLLLVLMLFGAFVALVTYRWSVSLAREQHELRGLLEQPGSIPARAGTLQAEIAPLASAIAVLLDESARLRAQLAAAQGEPAAPAGANDGE